MHKTVKNTFKKISISILLAILVILPFREAVAFVDMPLGWANSIGGEGTDAGLGIAQDDDLNIYSTGYFNGTSDFDPSVDEYELTSTGSFSSYVVKLNSDGNFIWAKSFGGNGGTLAVSVGLDSAGNSYVTGRFTGTTDFDPGAGTVNLTATAEDVFILKLDPDGDFVWAKSFGGNGNDWGTQLTIADNGTSFISGLFYETVDFDPGAGTTSLTSAGGSDIYVASFDPSGNFLWVKIMGGDSTDSAQAIYRTTNGEIYLTGYYSNTADMDPGAGTVNLISAGGYEIFLVSLDLDGDFVWAKSMGGAGYDTGYGIAEDANGNIYTTGYYSGTADFGLGEEEHLLTSGYAGIFINKFSTTGDFVWAKSIVGDGAGSGYSLAIDSGGYIYSTGYYNGTVDFDPGVDEFNLTAAGADDGYISVLDSDGNYLWASSIGGEEYDGGNGIIRGTEGGLYMTGFYGGIVDFEPGTGVFEVISSGGDDVYVYKLIDGALPADYPDLGPATADNITATTATLHGNITSTGGLDVFERGFEYGLDNSYGNIVVETDGPYDTGEFTTELQGLDCNTTYYFMSYAENSDGTTVTSSSFQTAACVSSGSSSSGSRSNSNTQSSDAPLLNITPICWSFSESNPCIQDKTGPVVTQSIGLVAPMQKFTRTLTMGSIGEDVKNLQKFLNSNNFIVATSGAGAANQETTTFGNKTKNALIKFQDAFAQQILTPIGLKFGTGNFGNSTMNFVNSLLN